MILVQLNQPDMIAATNDVTDPETGDVSKAWYPQGDIIVAQFSTGQAVLHGPLVFSSPINVFWEVVSENQATEDLLTGLGMSSASAKAAGRGNADYRTLIASGDRRLIRNQAGNPVGLYPKISICGRDGAREFLGNEDIEDAETLPDIP